MSKKILLGLSFILGLGLLAGCQSKTASVQETSVKEEQKIDVIVSFNPMREFVEAVGKEKVNVVTIIPQGVEPHDFEPKPRDMESLNKAKVFIYNGVGMEGWVDKALGVLNNKELVVIEASKGVDLIKLEHEDEHEDEEHKEEDKHEHGEFDPHVWLSLKEAKVQARNIKDALVQVDSANKEYYEKNYEDYAKQINDLYEEYKKKFDTVQNKNFVTGHAAFAYLCRDFGLEQKSVEDVFGEGEPTPQKIKELVDFSRKNNTKTIFMEELASPKVSETLASEIGAKVEKIYTLESKEDNKDYIQSMKDNLEKIFNSLK